MTPFYQSVELNTRERLSLAPGSYGSSSQPGLKILAYIDKASKVDKSGAMRHSFLVGALRPSREQLQAAAHAAGNGKSGATPFDEPEYEGTAFLSVTVHSDWSHPAALAMAFTEATRNKEGKLGHDYLAEAIASGEVDPQLAKDGQAYYRQIATDKVTAANTPPEKMEEAVESQYRKELMAISIKMGQLFTLQDWAGMERDPGRDPVLLVGTEFSGKVETSNLGQGQSEVASIYSRKKDKVAA
jgi:hypothetical protein